MILIIAAIVMAAIGRAIDQNDLAIAGIISAALIVGFTPSHRCVACGERFNAIEPEPDDDEAPLPLVTDMIEESCPRCGSREVYRVNHRRTYAIAMLGALAHMIMLPIGLFTPKKRCDACGMKI
jgi:DNA-directed RNA polymerase subunit RPC12/RpoP